MTLVHQLGHPKTKGIDERIRQAHIKVDRRRGLYISLNLII
jgi:hypothetical protein